MKAPLAQSPVRTRGLLRAAAGLSLSLLTVVGCDRNDMRDQARVDYNQKSDFYADGLASRQIPAGTVARGQLNADSAMFEGRRDGQLIDYIPIPIDFYTLQRGRERYNIYCAPCHNETGDGNGMIVRRGFTAPPSFFSEKLLTSPDGHYYDVITRGFGAMFSYAERVSPEDRWAITAYIRAMQFSRQVDVAWLSESQRAQLPSGAGAGSDPHTAPLAPSPSTPAPATQPVDRAAPTDPSARAAEVTAS